MLSALENIDSAVHTLLPIDEDAEFVITHQCYVDKGCYSVNDSSLPSASSPPSWWPSPLRWSSGPPCMSGQSSASWSLLRSLPESRWLWRIGEIPSPPGNTVNTRMSQWKTSDRIKGKVPQGVHLQSCGANWQWSQLMLANDWNTYLKVMTQFKCLGKHKG